MIFRRYRRAAVAVAAAIALGCVLSACDSSSSTGSPTTTPTPSHSSVTNPVFAAAATLTGPVPGNPVEPSSAVPLHLPAGYAEQEFFASGTATAFTSSTPKDGRWTISPATKAAYKTRILVRRPTDAHHFNGTVVVEWMNESAGEATPDWTYLNPMLTDDGYAYVAVTAQSVAIAGGQTVGTTQGAGLVKTNPTRYGSLHHPGDRYSFDIFAQIARTLRLGTNSTVLGGMRPAHIVATGESQSSAFLTTFANALQPQTESFDGIFIHSRGGGTVPIDGTSVASAGGAAGQLIRTDLSARVFQFETETDVTFLGFYSARQPDTDRIRTWEVAGTSHVDAYAAGAYANQLGCRTAVNDGPQHVVAQAAFTAFAKWVSSGKRPPIAKQLTLTGATPAALARDHNGNALGGLRTPAVDVPVAALSGEVPKDFSVPCLLLGSTKPYSPSRLTALYGSKSAYLAKYEQNLDHAISGGFILAADRSDLLAKAQAVQFA